MYYFEIKNAKTNEQTTATAKSMTQACKSIGWNVRECKCIYKAKEEL